MGLRVEARGQYVSRVLEDSSRDQSKHHPQSTLKRLLGFASGCGCGCGMLGCTLQDAYITALGRLCLQLPLDLKPGTQAGLSAGILA